MKTFRECSLGKETDKETVHHYGRYYDWCFPKEFREHAEYIVEVGVQRGGGILTWEEYFENAVIIGIDCDPACARKRTERTQIIIADQTDANIITPALLDKALDVVIDDASHVFSLTKATFELLWPFVKPGGWYVIEDLHASPHAVFGGEPSLGIETSLSGHFARKINEFMTYGGPFEKFVAGRSILFMQKGKQ